MSKEVSYQKECIKYFMLNEIQIPTNKLLHVYDNLFDYDYRVFLYEFFANSFFNINGCDDKNFNDQQIYSSFSMTDLHNLGLIKHPSFLELNLKYQLDSRIIKQIRVNCSTQSERNAIHSDKPGLTIVYHSNLKWNVEWGGHLMFLSEDLNDVYNVVTYKPGRVVVFDGTIPHLLITPSNLCRFHRLSFVIQYGPLR